MHHLIYMSRASTPPTTHDLVDLLRQSQHANNQAGVTGLLLYSEGRFIQLLEGEAAAVQATYARILRDPRHHAIHKLADRAVPERLFPAWSMTFQEVEGQQFEQLAGYLSPQELRKLDVAPEAIHAALLYRLRVLAMPAKKPSN